MSEGAMEPMMGWMMEVGGLIALLLVIVLVAAVVALVRLGQPVADVQAARSRGKVVKVIVIVLAVIGALTLAGAAAAVIMHFGMMAMGCCG